MNLLTIAARVANRQHSRVTPRMAAIVFEHAGKKLKVSWPDADSILDLLHELGSDELGNYVGSEEIPSEVAASIHAVLEKSLKGNKIGLGQVTTDSMGRALGDPMEVPVVGEKTPLSGYWKETLEKLLDVLSGGDGNVQSGGGPGPQVGQEQQAGMQECPECHSGPLTTDENGLHECPDCGWEEKAKAQEGGIAQLDW